MLKLFSVFLLTPLLAVGIVSADTITVTTVTDNGAGSLRAAISSATAGDTIIFTNTLSGSTITLTSGELLLNSNLTIDASALTNGICIDGNQNGRIFEVAAGATILLDTLTLTNGYITGYGGGILTHGTLTLNQCSVLGDYADYGGGIFQDAGTLVVSNSLVAGNQSIDCGGIYTYSGATQFLWNSTITGNSATNNGSLNSNGTGGGVKTYLGSIIIGNATIVGNTAFNYGGGIDNYGGLLILSNSIVAANNAPAPANIFGSYTGANDYTSGDPDLATLGNYGGPTQTMLPLPGSPVIDMGLDAVTNTFGTDQRGYPRLSGAHVDIGAVEVQQAAAATQAATLIMANSAVLNGTVTANDLTNTVYFEYGPASGNYLNESPPVTVYPGRDPTSVQVALVGLAESTMVHYQIVANDGVSLKLGGDVTLTTLGPPALSGVTATPFATSAILNAAINPMGAATQYYFEYKSPGVASQFSATNTLPAGVGPVNVSVPISGLATETTYSIELVAINSFGTSSASASDGTSLTFTTGQTLEVDSEASFLSTLATASSGDTIIFSPALSGVTLTLDQTLMVANNLTIDASGLSSEITLNGNNAVRIFEVNGGATLVLNSIIITNGKYSSGGGIANNGTLTLNQCTVSGNSSTTGGGIYNLGTLTLNECTLSGNSADMLGGGINNNGTLTLNECTLYGNSTQSAAGGGIYNGYAGTLTLNQCTLSGNSSHFGGGIANYDVTLIFNSIVAGNSAYSGSVDIYGNVTFSGTNIVQAYAFDVTGTTPINADPNLAPPGNYGGPTQTMPPLPGSPAIGAGSVADNTFATDQRGYSRTQNGLIDLGAVELQSPAANPPVLENITVPAGGGNGLQFTFTNAPVADFTVLTATDASLALTHWTVLGEVQQVAPGQYQFTDPQAAKSAQRFYRVSSP
jgi:hypothetical protein